ncbi:MAG TPA: type II toxin-antitoxin system RelE/ParE family toxin, partial [Chthoniobacteraceae bacterium]|nr:type II toxin-antitoxin system RelE/ParE family toxin [Chthoniobacteraceae bacterium]
MADYAVTIARSARKEIEALPSSMADRILARIEALMKAPRSAGVIKLNGKMELWRARVGDYRIVYSIDDVRKVIDISAVRHRRDVYRDL